MRRCGGKGPTQKAETQKEHEFERTWSCEEPNTGACRCLQTQPHDEKEKEKERKALMKWFVGVVFYLVCFSLLAKIERHREL